jgi:hypothetical protein
MQKIQKGLESIKLECLVNHYAKRAMMLSTRMMSLGRKDN